MRELNKEEHTQRMIDANVPPIIIVLIIEAEYIITARHALLRPQYDIIEYMN